MLVLVGRTYHVDWLRDSDPIAALFVAGVVVSVSWRLARRTIDALLDAAPPGVRSKIYDAVLRVDGVLEVDRIRIRRAGNRYFADLAVGLARTVTFQRSGQLAAAVTEAVHQSSSRCRRHRAAASARARFGKYFRPHPRRSHAQESQRA